MANQLRMAQVHAIQVLRDQGWSQRRIARELGIHRDTVGRYLRLRRAGPSPDTPGSPAKPAKVITGSDGPGGAGLAREMAGEATSRSQAEPFREIILAKLEQGLTAQRIWQDLRDEHGLPMVTNPSNGLSSVSKTLIRCPSAGWSAPPGSKPRWTSAPARR